MRVPMHIGRGDKADGICRSASAERKTFVRQQPLVANRRNPVQNGQVNRGTTKQLEKARKANAAMFPELSLPQVQTANAVEDP